MLGMRKRKATLLIIVLIVLILLVIYKTFIFQQTHKDFPNRTFFVEHDGLRVAEFFLSQDYGNGYEIRAVIERKQHSRINYYLGSVFSLNDLEHAKQTKKIIWKLDPRNNRMGQIGIFYTFDNDWGVISQTGYIFRILRRKDKEFEIEYLIKKDTKDDIELTNIYQLDEAIVVKLINHHGFVK